MEFRVGTDALAITVSSQNDFLTDATGDELRQIFTTAEKWSDVNPAWPDETIHRYIPGVDSGTLDFFVETAFERELVSLSTEELLAVIAANLSQRTLSSLGC